MSFEKISPNDVELQSATTSGGFEMVSPDDIELEKSSLWDYTKGVVKSPLAGAVEQAAAIPEASAIQRRAEVQELAKNQGIAEGVSPILMPSGKPLGGIPISGSLAIRTPQAPSPEQVAEAKKEIHTPLEEAPSYRLGQRIRAVGPEVPQDVEQSYPYQVGKVFGQAAVQIAPLALTPGLGVPLGYTMSATAETSDMYRRAKEHGADEETAVRAAMEAQPLGLFDVIGEMGLLKGINVIGKIPGVPGYVDKVARIAAKYPRTTAGLMGAAEEAATEIPQGVLEDEIAKREFGEKVDQWNTAWESGTVAGGAGFALGVLAKAVGLKLGKFKAPQVTRVTEADFAKPTPETGPTVEDIYQEHLKRTEPSQVIPPTETVHEPWYGRQEEPVVEPTAATGAPLVTPETPTGAETRTTGPATDILSQGFEKVSPTEVELSPQATWLHRMLQQKFDTLEDAQIAAQGYSGYVGRTLYPHSVEGGWQLRMGIQADQVQPTTELSSTIEQSENVPGPEQVIQTEQGPRLQKEVDSDLVAQLRRDLAARREAELNDTQVREAGLSGVEREGQAAVEAGPVEGGGEEAAQAGGVLQTPEENLVQLLNEVKEKEVIPSGQVETETQVEAKAPNANEAQIGRVLAEPVAYGKTKLSAGVQLARLRKETGLDYHLAPSRTGTGYDIMPGPETSKQKVEVRPQKLGAKRRSVDSYEAMLREEGLGDIEEEFGTVEDEEAPEGSMYEGLRITKLFSGDPLAATAQLWRSKMVEQLSSDKIPKVVGKQEFLNRVQAMMNKGEFKKEEWNDTIRMTRFQDWLEKWGDQPIPREAIVEELRQNGIRVEEVVRGIGEPGPIGWTLYKNGEPFDGPWSDYDRMELMQRDLQRDYPNVNWELRQEAAQIFSAEQQPKHEQYTLRGGSNYVELVLTSPQAEELPVDPTHFAEGQGQRQIGWIRGKEFTDAKGERVFLIEEMQSKRHQEGREEGYSSRGEQWKSNLSHDEYNRLMNMFANGQMTAEEFRTKTEGPKGVPDAPFRESAMRLMARRVLRWAAERGIKKVAWTTGEQQAERWSLRQVADELEYDNGTLYGYKYGNTNPIFNRQIPASDLPQYVGPELTDKLQQPHDRIRVPEGVEFYHSKWPEKIYGFEGRYNKSVIGTAMKEAMKPFKGDITIINAPKSQEVQFRNVENVITGEENLQTIPGDELSEKSNFEFSKQPGVELTDEQVKHYRNTPMYLYSFDLLHPFQSLKQDMESLPGGGGLTRLGTTYRRYASIPSWAGETQKKFGDWYHRSTQIMRKWQEPLQRSLSTLDGWFRLSTDEATALQKALWDIEGRRLAAVPSREILFKQFGERKLAESNPQFLKEFEGWLRSKGFSEEAVKTGVATRQGLNQDFVEHYNTSARNPEVSESVLEQLEKFIGFQPNYLPHNWYGNHYIEGKNANGETVARVAVNLKVAKLLGSTYKVGRLISKLQKMPGFEGITWDRTLKDTDENERYYINVPVAPEVIGRVLDEAVKSLQANPNTAEAAEIVRKALPSEVLNILKTKGFSNFAKRGGMLGFEKEDLLKVLADYKVGTYGSLRKLETVREFARSMLELKPEKADWKLLDQYFQDQMSPYSRLEAGAQFVRDVLFMRYMSARIKPAFVNLSNQLVTAIPLLGTQSNYASAFARQSKAAVEVTAQFGKESAQKLRRLGIFGHPFGKDILEPEILELGRKFQLDGTVQPQMTREMLEELRMGYRKVPRILGRMISGSRDLFALPMETTEWYSRYVTMVAAARTISDGKITNPNTLAQYGLQKGEKIPLTDPRVEQFARKMVEQSHGEYGRHNRPPIVRSGRMGKLLSIPYTFRFFTHNLLELWKHMLGQGARGIAGTAASIAGQVVFGGLLKGIPLATTMALLYGAFSGDEPEEELRKRLPGNEDMKDAMLYGGLAYGIPTPFGDVPKIAIGSSLEFDVPESVSELLKFALTGERPEFREDPITGMAGASGGLVKDIIGGFNAWANGDKQRALEYMMPLVVLRDVLTANRLATKGQYSLTGQPLPAPGEVEPFKITEPEARARALGFQPLSMEKNWRQNMALNRMGLFRRSAQDRLANRFANAFVDGNQQEMENVLDEIDAWNLYWGSKDKPEYMINPRSAIETRLSPKQPEKRLRGRALELREGMGF